MASMNSLSVISLHSPKFSIGPDQISYCPRRRPNSVSFAGNSPESLTATENPEVELEFIGVHLFTEKRISFFNLKLKLELSEAEASIIEKISFILIYQQKLY